MKIALAGNPNCGKTTLFNVLTGSTARVGNWPGVTVDKKEGIYKKFEWSNSSSTNTARWSESSSFANTTGGLTTLNPRVIM